MTDRPWETSHQCLQTYICYFKKPIINIIVDHTTKLKQKNPQIQIKVFRGSNPRTEKRVLFATCGAKNYKKKRPAIP